MRAERLNLSFWRTPRVACLQVLRMRVYFFPLFCRLPNLVTTRCGLLIKEASGFVRLGDGGEQSKLRGRNIRKGEEDRHKAPFFM